MQRRIQLAHPTHHLPAIYLPHTPNAPPPMHALNAPNPMHDPNIVTSREYYKNIALQALLWLKQEDVLIS